MQWTCWLDRLELWATRVWDCANTEKLGSISPDKEGCFATDRTHRTVCPAWVLTVILDNPYRIWSAYLFFVWQLAKISVWSKEKLELFVYSLVMSEIVILPNSFFIGNGYLQLAGDGWKENRWLRFHEYFPPETYHFPDATDVLHGCIIGLDL